MCIRDREKVMLDESMVKSDSSRLLMEDEKKYYQIWSAAAYITCPHVRHYPQFYRQLCASINNQTDNDHILATTQRPSRRATTDNRFHTSQNLQIVMMAHYIANTPARREQLENIMYAEADWALGRNPGNIVEMTGLGQRHLTDIYTCLLYTSIFETVLSIENPNHRLDFPSDEENLDGLNFLAGKRVDEVNKMAELGTSLAHVDGDVPNIRVSVPKLDERYLGQLIYFFEIACGISGLIQEVNPFNQPGVEAYKKNMFALLNKPGYEAESKAIKELSLIHIRCV